MQSRDQARGFPPAPPRRQFLILQMDIPQNKTFCNKGINGNSNLTAVQVLHSSAQDDFFLQILLNCGKQCNGTKAKLNSLAGLQGSAQTVYLLSFLISNFWKPISLSCARVTDTSRPAESTDPTLPELLPKTWGVDWQVMVTLTFQNQPGQGTLPCSAGTFRAGHFAAQFSCAMGGASWGQPSTLSLSQLA